jgi:hypothetical protein
VPARIFLWDDEAEAAVCDALAANGVTLETYGSGVSTSAEAGWDSKEGSPMLEDEEW